MSELASRPGPAAPNPPHYPIDELCRQIEETADLADQEQMRGHEARITERVAAQVDQSLRGIEARVRQVEPKAARPWSPDRFHAQGESVTMNGGSWTVTALRGADKGEAPGPDSSVWSLTSDGLDRVEAKTRGGALALTIRTAGGKSHDVELELGLPRFVGTFNPKRAY